MARVLPLSAGDAAWVAETLSRVVVLCRSHGDSLSSKRPSLAALDALWSATLRELEQTNGDPNDLINLVGIGLGQHLVDALGLSWVAVSDEYGNDVGVYGEPNALLICPTSLVAKRWDRKEASFVSATVTAICSDAQLLRG